MQSISLLVLLAFVALQASATPMPRDLVIDKRGLFGDHSRVDNVTHQRALAKITRMSSNPSLCSIDGTILARGMYAVSVVGVGTQQTGSTAASHYDSIVAGAARLIMKGVTAAIKTQDQQKHWNYIAPFFYTDGTEKANVQFTVSTPGAQAQRISAVRAGNHGVTNTPFTFFNVPCNTRSVPLAVTPGAGYDNAAIQVVAEEGFSIMSDVDDTMRVTQVLSARKAVENTLISPFIATNGVVAWYQRLAKQLATPDGDAPAFHYVSGSPSQLYRPLYDFIARVGYPSGSLALRQFGFFNLNFWKGTQPHKLERIPELINMFPKRKWILVGDSAEKDPETYGIVAREALAKGIDIKCIYIRKVSGTDAKKEAELNKPERFEKDFAGIPRTKWATFFDPSEVAGADIANGKCQ